MHAGPLLGRLFAPSAGKTSRAAHHVRQSWRNNMNKFAMTIIAASLALIVPAYADDAHHPETAVAATAKSAEPVKQMQDNVKKMQSQLVRIGKTKDDGERQKLMAEHMKTMHENMMLAKGMTGCPMMKGGMDKGAMQMDGTAEAEPMMLRMHEMEKRMDSMQIMMEQMGKTPNK
jgi:hypothetical protein